MAQANARTLLVAGCLSGLVLVACAKQGQDEMTWTRAALERNDRLEIVAADQQTRSFTVRLKDSGELRVVRADQIVGTPGTPGGTVSAPTAIAVPAATAAPSPAETGASGKPPAASAAGAAIATAGEAATPADEQAAAAPSEPKVFASRALRAGNTPPVPGQVLEAGPGYTIEAGSGTATAAAAREPGTATTIEYRHEPIVCQGARMLHIDNRNLQFDGDAVSAEDGCEIHITNSRIRATGTGVSAHAANVHIDNSLIEGDAASIDASGGAQIYTASSRFRGLSRHLDTAAVHDLGGNVWN